MLPPPKAMSRKLECSRDLSGHFFALVYLPRQLTLDFLLGIQPLARFDIKLLKMLILVTSKQVVSPHFLNRHSLSGWNKPLSK